MSERSTNVTSKDVGSIEDIRARVAQPVTEIVDNPREYYRVQQILRDRSDLLVHLDQLTAILDRNPVMLNGKHMGGSNVCTTCEAHCVTAEDDRKEIARLQSALRIASEELTQYVDFQQKSGYFEYAAESQKRLDAVNAALSGDSHCAHETNCNAGGRISSEDSTRPESSGPPALLVERLRTALEKISKCDSCYDISCDTVYPSVEHRMKAEALAALNGKRPSSEKAEACQHDLLLPDPTVDVDSDGMGGSCRVCKQTWSFRRAKKASTDPNPLDPTNKHFRKCLKGHVSYSTLFPECPSCKVERERAENGE